MDGSVGSECTQGLGAEVLEAAYGVIANVRDLSALKVRLVSFCVCMCVCVCVCVCVWARVHACMCACVRA